MVDVKKFLNKRDNAKTFDEIREKNKPDLDAGRIAKRRSQAKAELDKWRDLLETAYHYAMPNFNPFDNAGMNHQMQGQQYNADIYDLTLPIAHKRLADKMLMGMVPQGQQWMQFKPGDDFGDPDTSLYQQALEATQRMTEQFFKILDRSNFYLAVGESLNDVLISTGVLAINEGTRKNPIKFEAVPTSNVMFEGNAEGGIDAVFRDWFNVRIENIKTMWPNAKVEKLNKQPDDKINLWEAAWIDHDTGDDNKRYQYVVMTDGKDVLLHDSNPSWPWVVYRMRKLAGETRGRGPSLEAFPTAATINKAMEDELIAAAFTANPMFMAASDSAFNTETFEPRPGTMVPVQMVMGQWPIEKFPAGGNIEFSSLLVNDFRQQINDLLFAFPLGNVSAPDRTATEAQIRFQENLESFSAMVPRLQNEFFAPVIQRSLWIINKVLPETFADIDENIREKMLSVDGQILSMSFETPLMTAKGRIKTDNLLGFYEAFASLVGQEAATAALKPSEVALSVAENQNVDMKNIRSKDELEQLEQSAGQAADQVAEQQGVDLNEQQPPQQ